MNRLCILLFVIFLVGCTPKTTETPSDKDTGATGAEVIDLDIQSDADDVEEDTSAAPGVPSKDNAAQAAKSAGDSQYKIMAWNVELDGGAKPDVIAGQMQEFKDYDIIALMETRPETFEVIKKSTKHKAAISRSGNNIRLALLWNDERFSIEKFEELDDLNDENMRHRSPWAMLVKERATDQAFYLVTVHLARGREQLRQRQARGIRDWTREKTLPVIAIGDFNFDYVFADNKGNKAFDQFLEDGIMKWVRPEEFIDTNWYDPESDGIDNYPGSMLDFAFVAGPAKDWSPKCRVIVRDGDFPDDKSTSDHRPIELLLSPRS